MCGRDKTASTPPARTSLHEQVITEIRERILSGDWPPGHRIPSEYELADQYACSRMTINKAVTQLARAGYLERRRRAGTFVRQPQVQSAILEIPDIKTEVAALHVPYRFTLIERSQKPGDPATQERLEVDMSEPLLHLTCLHFAGSTPFCLEQRVINLIAVPDAEQVDFTAVSPGAWLLEQVPWQEAEHTITAISADADLASLLDVPKGSPCLSVERRTWNADHVVTVVRIIYPAANHSLVARFTPS